MTALSSACGGSVGSGGSPPGSKDPGDCPCDTTTECVESCLCDVDCAELPPTDGAGGDLDIGGGEDDGAGDQSGGEDPIDIPDSDGGGDLGAAECSGRCNTDGECDARCGGNGACVSTNGERSCEPGPAGGGDDGDDGDDGGGGGGGGLPGGGEIPTECFSDCADNSDCAAACGAGWSCQGFGGFGVCLPDGFV